MSKIEKMFSFFNGNFNCAQSVLATYSPQFGLEEDMALRISTGFEQHGDDLEFKLSFSFSSKK